MNNLKTSQVWTGWAQRLTDRTSVTTLLSINKSFILPSAPCFMLKLRATKNLWTELGLFTLVILNHTRLISLLIGKGTALVAFPVVTMVTVAYCVIFELQFPCPLLPCDISKSHDDPCGLHITSLMVKSLARKFTIAERKNVFISSKASQILALMWDTNKFRTKQSFHFTYPGSWGPTGTWT